VIALFLAPSGFLDPVQVPDLGTFTVHVLELSLPVWCLTFGVRFRDALWGPCRRILRAGRRVPVEGEPSGLWDEWLDGPSWNRPR
jgi:hypothetical protein